MKYKGFDDDDMYSISIHIYYTCGGYEVDWMDHTVKKLCLGNMTAGSGPGMLALCFDLFFFVSFVFLGITENIML